MCHVNVGCVTTRNLIRPLHQITAQMPHRAIRHIILEITTSINHIKQLGHHQITIDCRKCSMDPIPVEMYLYLIKQEGLPHIESLPPVRKNSSNSLAPLESLKSSAANIYSPEISPQRSEPTIRTDTYTFPNALTVAELSQEETKFKHKESILRTENDQLEREIQEISKAVEAATASIDRLKYERRILLGAILSKDDNLLKRAFDDTSDESSMVISTNASQMKFQN